MKKNRIKKMWMMSLAAMFILTEVCLLYLTKQKGERRNDSGEFILERR